MKYLVVENDGVCPVEGFTVLGVSTARGNASAIGQFGSGAKHGILTCLRHGLEPVVWCGSERLQFSTLLKTANNGASYSQVYVKIGNRQPIETSMSLEFGAIDWQGLDMALREFISNALDSTGGDASKVRIRLMDKPRSNPNGTVIAIPAMPDVLKFYNGIAERFLHYAGKSIPVGVIAKNQRNGAKIYRKGVLVRQVEGVSSLFDYNFGDELPIDESRNMSDYSVSYAAVDKVVKSADNLAHVLKTLSEGVECWESSFDSWTLKSRASNNPQVWKEAFLTAFGENGVLVPSTIGGIAEAVTRKGFKPIYIGATNWYAALLAAKVKQYSDVLDGLVNDRGHKLTDPSAELKETAQKVWQWLDAYGFTKGKAFPQFKEFQTLMEGGAQVAGYYKDNVCYIDHAYVGNRAVILEEIAHYITGAHDETRDFQDFAFKFAASLIE